MGTLYYCASGPVISLFALGQRRFITFCACIAWIILVGAMILPVRVSYIRNGEWCRFFAGVRRPRWRFAARC